MAQYIDKATLLAEINRLKNISLEYGYTTEQRIVADVGKDLTLKGLLDYTDTLEVKEVDLELIIGWFDHIAQIADDRMTLTGQRMTDAHALDEIKCLAKNSSEFIKMHYKAQKG